jgi:hypothetical protein
MDGTAGAGEGLSGGLDVSWYGRVVRCEDSLHYVVGTTGEAPGAVRRCNRWSNVMADPFILGDMSA